MRRNKIYTMFDNLPDYQRDETTEHNHENYRVHFGPGHWDYMHRTAAKANTDDLKYVILDIIDLECKCFGCDACRKDFSNLWKEYQKDLNKYWTVYYKYNGDIYEVGMLKLTIDLHNDVNRKLNKPIMSYDKAIEMYISDSTGCNDFVCQDDH